jgi:transcriptional regulator with PAS, ATPase and Fis domain
MPSEDLYRDIVENMHDGIYFVDRERRITYWNKRRHPHVREQDPWPQPGDG